MPQTPLGEVTSLPQPWCALLTAVKNYNKSLERLQDQRQLFKTETKTKTFIFVLEAPRDQYRDLEDYVTVSHVVRQLCDKLLEFNLGLPILTYGPQV